MCVYVCVLCICVCVSVCVFTGLQSLHRDPTLQTQLEAEPQGVRAGEWLCVCMSVRACACVCGRVCERERIRVYVVRVCARVCAYTCMCMCTCLHGLYRYPTLHAQLEAEPQRM